MEIIWDIVSVLVLALWLGTLIPVLRSPEQVHPWAKTTWFRYLHGIAWILAGLLVLFGATEYWEVGRHIRAVFDLLAATVIIVTGLTAIFWPQRSAFFRI